MTGETDTRVDPMHAKKMAALMQAEAKNGLSQERPILLRIDTKAGHGQGKPVAKADRREHRRVFVPVLAVGD